ncbi:MAG: hypothetical protein AMXMBFR13_18500 [Phycisphaerae bacterium]
MALLVRDALRTLAENRLGPCLSIYAKMEKAGEQTRQNPVRLKNLLFKAERKLSELNSLRRPEIEQFLDPARQLLEDTAFWQHQSDTLAVFRSPDHFLTFPLPLEVEEVTVVSDSFHIKPLLPLLTDGGRFYILALSENDVRLYQATRTTIDEVPVAGMPRSLAQALSHDDPEKSLQFHGHMSGPDTPARGMFHGHGMPKDVEKDNLLRYFRRIDWALQNALRNENAPLVLAAVQYFLPIYQTANHYPHLMDKMVEGNPEANRKSLDELHRQAWATVEPVLEREKQRSAERVREAVGTSRGSDKLAEVVPAAFHGRVDRLFVPVGVQVWGEFDPHTPRVDIHESAQPGDKDLLNTAAFGTYLNGGTVFAVPPDQMPVPSTAAAVFRY